MKRIFFFVVLALLFVFTLSLKSADKFYVSITGILGESVDPGHQNEIEAYAYNFEIRTAQDMNTGAGKGKRQMSNFIICKRLDSSTPKLLENCSRGKSIDNVVVKILKQGAAAGVIHFTITLRKALVINIREYKNIEAIAGTSLEMEEVAFSFEEIEVEDNSSPVTNKFLEKWAKK